MDGGNNNTTMMTGAMMSGSLRLYGVLRGGAAELLVKEEKSNAHHEGSAALQMAKTTTTNGRVLTVACIQMHSKNEDMDGNFLRAHKLVRKAAASGAKLVLLPELMAAGYLLSERVWRYAEPSYDGQTQTFLKYLSNKYDIYVGTTFLEADEDGQFWNTFLLHGPPNATEYGRVRKMHAASFEAFYFKAGSLQQPKVFDTPLGRLGVNICFENFLYEMVRPLTEQSIDLLLMPFSCPSPDPGNLPFLNSTCDLFCKFLTSMGPTLASMLKVPTMYCNKTGEWSSPLPLVGIVIKSSFPGGCTICNNKGEILSRGPVMTNEECVVLADVELGQCSSSSSSNPKETTNIPCFAGRYVVPIPWAIKRTIFMAEFGGSHCYRLNPRRAGTAERQAVKPHTLTFEQLDVQEATLLIAKKDRRGRSGIRARTSHGKKEEGDAREDEEKESKKAKTRIKDTTADLGEECFTSTAVVANEVMKNCFETDYSETETEQEEEEEEEEGEGEGPNLENYHRKRTWFKRKTKLSEIASGAEMFTGFEIERDKRYSSRHSRSNNQPKSRRRKNRNYFHSDPLSGHRGKKRGDGGEDNHSPSKIRVVRDDVERREVKEGRKTTSSPSCMPRLRLSLGASLRFSLKGMKGRRKFELKSEDQSSRGQRRKTVSGRSGKSNNENNQPKTNHSNTNSPSGRRRMSMTEEGHSTLSFDGGLNETAVGEESYATTSRRDENNPSFTSSSGRRYSDSCLYLMTIDSDEDVNSEDEETVGLQERLQATQLLYARLASGSSLLLETMSTVQLENEEELEELTRELKQKGEREEKKIDKGKEKEKEKAREHRGEDENENSKYVIEDFGDECWSGSSHDSDEEHQHQRHQHQKEILNGMEVLGADSLSHIQGTICSSLQNRRLTEEDLAHPLARSLCAE
ncbi:CN hydrolase domain-containing protein [Balamuthia mandrillaris]